MIGQPTFEMTDRPHRRRWFGEAGRIVCIIGIVGAAWVASATMAEALTLTETVATAISTHPTIKAAEAAERAARQGISQARAGFLPTIDITGDTGFQHANNTTTRARNSRAEGGDPGLNTWRKAVGVSVTQSLFDGFDTWWRTDAAQSNADSARMQVIDAQHQIALRAIQAYLGVVRNRLVLALAEDNVRKHKDVVKSVRIKAQSGGGDQGDVNQAESRLSLAEARLVEVQGDLREAAVEYLEAVGEMPGELETPGKLVDFPLDEEAVLDVALRTNPALQADSLTLKARHAEAEAARSEFLPSVDLELSENRDWNANGVQEGTIDRKAIVVVRYNIFSGGLSTATVKRAAELRGEAVQREAETRRLVEKQSRIDFNLFRTASQRMAALERRVIASADAVEAYNRQFKIGRRTLLDVLDVENELYQAKIAFVDVDLQLQLAQYRVLATMGVLLSTFEVNG